MAWSGLRYSVEIISLGDFGSFITRQIKAREDQGAITCHILHDNEADEPGIAATLGTNTANCFPKDCANSERPFSLVIAAVDLSNREGMDALPFLAAAAKKAGDLHLICATGSAASVNAERAVQALRDLGHGVLYFEESTGPAGTQICAMQEICPPAWGAAYQAIESFVRPSAADELVDFDFGDFQSVLFAPFGRTTTCRKRFDDGASVSHFLADVCETAVARGAYGCFVAIVGFVPGLKTPALDITKAGASLNLLYSLIPGELTSEGAVEVTVVIVGISQE